MSNGYSYQTVKRIQTGDSTSPGVLLGKFCLDNDISVRRVAEALGVSRQTIYSWFSGKAHPSGQHLVKIQRLLAAAKPR